MLTVVRKLCGHPVTGPSAVVDQSIARIKLPVSPPPAKNASGSETGAKFLPGSFMSAFKKGALQLLIWPDDVSIPVRVELGRYPSFDKLRMIGAAGSGRTVHRS